MWAKYYFSKTFVRWNVLIKQMLDFNIADIGFHCQDIICWYAPVKTMMTNDNEFDFYNKLWKEWCYAKKKYLDAKFCVVWKQIASIVTGLWPVWRGNFGPQMWPFQFVSHTKWAFFQKLLHYVEREQCFFQDKYWLLTFDESACWYFLATQLTRMWTMAQTILLYLHLAIVVDSSVG